MTKPRARLHVGTNWSSSLIPKVWSTNSKLRIVVENVKSPQKSISQSREGFWFSVSFSCSVWLRDAGSPYTTTRVQRTTKGIWPKKDLYKKDQYYFHQLLHSIVYSIFSPSPANRIREKTTKRCSNTTADDIGYILIASVECNIARRDQVWVLLVRMVIRAIERIHTHDDYRNVGHHPSTAQASEHSR